MQALRKDIDGLPRRVNDQFKNLGDMVNFVIVGSQKDVQAALDAANWHVADTDNKKAVFEAALETYENKDYLADADEHAVPVRPAAGFWL